MLWGNQGMMLSMALMKCPECGHTVSDQALACPSCGAPPNADKGSARIEITANSSTLPSLADYIEGAGSRTSGLLQRLRSRKHELLLTFGAVGVLVSVFLPLITRPVIGSTLTYYDHSSVAAIALFAIIAVITVLYFFRRYIESAVFATMVGVLVSIVLYRLDAAFQQLVHPPMTLHVGAYALYVAAVLMAWACVAKALSARSERLGEDAATGAGALHRDSDFKALFVAWLAQRGTTDDLSLAQRQALFEEFRGLYEKGALDLIGLRRSMRRRKQ